MNISLQDKESRVDACAKNIASRLLSVPIIYSKRIGGGLNSRVYQLGEKNIPKYILKFYHRHESDRRDRLAAEFTSLTFLWKNGIKFIPEPIAMDEDEGCAVYSFIDGQKILYNEVGIRDIEQTVEFLKALKSLRSHAGIFPCASEAFFSLEDINENIQTRVNRLRKIQETGAEFDALAHYLDREFVPFWQTLIEWARNHLSELGMSVSRSIDEGEKTLSPSDFGFHNALRDQAGHIIFLDFEHFGWDDPAKTILDFLLHPAMTLERSLKQKFVTGVLELFKECEQLEDRMKFLYPFYGLKWCLIFLNEFIPEDRERRHFAQIEILNEQDILKEQLLKAQRILGTMKETYDKFPYDTSL